MPMKLLERLCCVQLPIHIDVAADIEKCEILRNAAWIEADLPPVLHGRGTSTFSGEAIVMRVTKAGVAALQRNRLMAGRPEMPALPVSVAPSAHPASFASSMSASSTPPVRFAQSQKQEASNP